MNDSNQILDTNLEEKSLASIPLYSRNAIWGFSFFFSVIFGGVLCMQNLKDVGKPREANIVLMFAILYTVGSIVLFSVWETSPRFMNYAINIVGASILTEVFIKTNIPNSKDYDTKSIRKPLLISLALTVPIVVAFFVATIMHLI